VDNVARHIGDFWDGATNFPLQPAITNGTVTSIGSLIANAAEKGCNLHGMVAGKHWERSAFL